VITVEVSDCCAPINTIQSVYCILINHVFPQN